MFKTISPFYFLRGSGSELRETNGTERCASAWRFANSGPPSFVLMMPQSENIPYLPRDVLLIYRGVEYGIYFSVIYSCHRVGFCLLWEGLYELKKNVRWLFCHTTCVCIFMLKIRFDGSKNAFLVVLSKINIDYFIDFDMRPLLNN